MKECELCNLPARMYCESDEASLCWDCDAKVHSANFLVARHSRNLLCHVCQLPTPWKASGGKLGWTVSVCESCANNSNGRGERVEVDGESRGTNDDDDDVNEEEDDEDDDDDDINEEEDDEDDDDDDINEEEDDEDDDDNDEDGDGDDDEDGENQAVPWSSTPPPPVASSSSSDEFSNSGCKRGIAESTMLFSFKRMPENADLDCQDDLGCSASLLNNERALVTTGVGCSDDDEATSYGSFKALKDLKKTPTTSSDQPESSAAALVCSLERFLHDGLSGKDATATILGICKLTKDPGAVDLVSIDHH